MVDFSYRLLSLSFIYNLSCCWIINLCASISTCEPPFQLSKPSKALWSWATSTCTHRQTLLIKASRMTHVTGSDKWLHVTIAPMIMCHNCTSTVTWSCVPEKPEHFNPVPQAHFEPQSLGTMTGTQRALNASPKLKMTSSTCSYDASRWPSTVIRSVEIHYLKAKSDDDELVS